MTYESDMPNTKLIITGNIVYYNQFIGTNTALFHFLGGQVEIFENTFLANGFLSLEIL